MTYHTRIKEEYAAAIIEELQRKNAEELVPEEEAFEIPQWQQDEVLRRIEKYKNSPEQLLDEGEFF